MKNHDGTFDSNAPIHIETSLLHNTIPRMTTIVVTLLVFCSGLPSCGNETQDLGVLESHESVLALVAVDRPIDEMGLPIHAHLQGLDGNEYVLTISTTSALNDLQREYEILDDVGNDDYAIIRESSNDVAHDTRADISQYVDVLHDDGINMIVRTEIEEADSIAELGYEIRWVDSDPFLFASPNRLELNKSVAPYLHSKDATYSPIVADMIDSVRVKTVRRYTANLTGERKVTIGGHSYTIETRHTNSRKSIRMATKFVFEHLSSLELSTSYQSWFRNRSGVVAQEKRKRNVIGEQVGTVHSDEIILITAHLDNMPGRGKVAPGADDNASGCVAVMIAADILSQYSFERTIRYVLFTGEEQGLFGSREYAERASSDGDNIVGVYNLDMIAWNNLNGPDVELAVRRNSDPDSELDRELAELMIDVVDEYDIDLNATIITDDWGWSDHWSFWSRGFPAITLTESEDDFNAFYHTTHDGLSNLNIQYFANNVRAAVGTIAQASIPTGGDDS